MELLKALLKLTFKGFLLAVTVSGWGALFYFAMMYDLQIIR